MNNRNNKNKNQLRIIAGEWRGRKLPFIALEGLRPTPDSVRETLFNWLQNIIYGARCLDLYSGSGALGFEAISRGASEVVMLDNQNKVTRQLQENSQLLACDKANIHCQNALNYLENKALEPFNIVFIDPPYNKNLVEPTCRLLEDNGWLAPDALIYLEVEKGLYQLPVPNNWELLRSKKAGHVSYHLLQRHEKSSDGASA